MFRFYLIDKPDSNRAVFLQTKLSIWNVCLNQNEYPNPTFR